MKDIYHTNAIQNMLDFVFKKDILIDIQEEHQKLVMDRFEKVRENPERLLDLEEAQEP